MTGSRIWPLGAARGIMCPEPPDKIADYADLREMADTMLAARRKRFPALVQSGDIDQAEADRLLAAAEAIAGDWAFIVAGEGEPATVATLIARRDLLDASIETIIDIARQRGDLGDALNEQAHRVIALRWHLEPGRQTAALATLTFKMRAAAAANRKERTHAH